MNRWHQAWDNSDRQRRGKRDRQPLFDVDEPTPEERAQQIADMTKKAQRWKRLPKDKQIQQVMGLYVAPGWTTAELEVILQDIDASVKASAYSQFEQMLKQWGW